MKTCCKSVSVETQTEEPWNEGIVQCDFIERNDFSQQVCFDDLVDLHDAFTDEMNISASTALEESTIFEEVQKNDSNYNPEIETGVSSTDESFSVSRIDDSLSGDNSEIGVLEDKKYVVFEQKVDELIQRIKCPTCEGWPFSTTKSISGTSLQVKTACMNGHTILTWASQPLIGKMPAFNLLYSAAIVFSGKYYISGTEKSSVVR